MSFYWFSFVAASLLVLALDFALLHRKPRPESASRSMIVGVLWANVAVLASWGIHSLVLRYGPGTAGGFELAGLHGGLLEGRQGAAEASLQFLTAYLVEASLALDNVLVMAAILKHFKVPSALRHRVLFAGIPLAMLCRGLLIGGMCGTLQALPWFVYAIAAWLVLGMLRMMVKREGWLDSSRHPVIWLLNRFFPISDRFEGVSFVSTVNGKWQLTRLVTVVLMIETADLLFALDSIPAMLAVSRSPWILFVASVLALFTVRSLFFVLQGWGGFIRYIKIGFVLVLGYLLFVLATNTVLKVPTYVSLSVIASILAAGALLAAILSKPGPVSEVTPLGEDAERIARLTLKQAQKLIVLVVGATITLIGLLMLPGPGPGLLVIPAGLAILAAEFTWARKLLRAYGNLAAKLGEKGEDTFIKVPRPWLVPAVMGFTVAATLTALAFHVAKPGLVWSIGIGALLGQSIWAYGNIRKNRAMKLRAAAQGLRIEPHPTWPIILGAVLLVVAIGCGLAFLHGPPGRVLVLAGPAVVGYGLSVWLLLRSRSQAIERLRVLDRAAGGAVVVPPQDGVGDGAGAQRSGG